MAPSTQSLRIVDIAERVVSTFLQAFIAALLSTSAGGIEARVDWLNALLIGLFAALVALVTSLLVLLRSVRKKFSTYPLLDLAYRAVLTFVQTFSGLLLAAGAASALTFDYDTALKTSVIAAGTALLKGLVGINAEDTAGASTLVQRDAYLEPSE